MNDEQFKSRVVELLESIESSLQKQNREAGLQPPTPSRKKAKTISVVEGKKPDTGALIKVYCDAYKARYGEFPIVDGRTQGAATQLLKYVPLERAQVLVQAYLQIEDRWFVTRYHDFSTFTQNVSKVAVALNQGKTSTSAGGFDWGGFWRKVDEQGRVQSAD